MQPCKYAYLSFYHQRRPAQLVVHEASHLDTPTGIRHSLPTVAANSGTGHYTTAWRRANSNVGRRVPRWAVVGVCSGAWGTGLQRRAVNWGEYCILVRSSFGLGMLVLFAIRLLPRFFETKPLFSAFTTRREAVTDDTSRSPGPPAGVGAAAAPDPWGAPQPATPLAQASILTPKRKHTIPRVALRNSLKPHRMRADSA
uniref:Uncharacterized protein n=1 Tax=Mycena chlorophos TaxID=658473 RepID=A0ABQ0LU40_MYCCL|nr:predicted protein [Mycena chlorophos]